jgi:hypothetical protein
MGGYNTAVDRYTRAYNGYRYNGMNLATPCKIYTIKNNILCDFVA